MSKEVNFLDILEPRRTQSGVFSFMSRYWDPKRTMVLDKYCLPQELKNTVSNSVYLDAVIDAESCRSGVSKEDLQKEVATYLEEMGLDKKIHIIRWMGIVFLKICFMMRIKLFVNDPPVMKLKSTMGTNPVLFLPTHRSYADFCLMTYLCYHYDIDFPAVAAGMGTWKDKYAITVASDRDFYSMAVIGSRMRETGAFYIRRSLVGAPLYAATLKQYVRTVVAKHCAPIEFFLEGTRSRSNKSLPPKYGILAMTLMPFFAREVSDITIVPVNISYERLMEHGLFAYEHLGVPKPKESTGGFLKALRTLNDNFGNIYINLGSPLSLREHLHNTRSQVNESLKPVDLQELTTEQFKQVQNTAEYVIALQQKCTVVSISNLLAMVMMGSLINDQALTIEKVVLEVKWMGDTLASLGASVIDDDIRTNVERMLLVHSKMITLDHNNELKLVAETAIAVSNDVKKKVKGHILAAETMALSIPVIQLQLYVNPILHYLVPQAIVYLIVSRGNVTRDELVAKYHMLRKMLRYEFFYIESDEDNKLQTAINYCIQNNLITEDANMFKVSDGNGQLQYLLRWSLLPALTSLIKCMEIISQQEKCKHKDALKLIQQRVETDRCHPYCLSLEATANCVEGLSSVGALIRDKQQNIYQSISDVMQECHRLVSSVLPVFNVDFGSGNSVITDRKALARL